MCFLWVEKGAPTNYAFGNWDKLQPDGPLGSYADLTYYNALC